MSKKSATVKKKPVKRVNAEKLKLKLAEESEKKRLNREIKTSQFNELDLVADWRKKLRIIKAKELEDEADICQNDFDRDATKLLHHITSEFENYVKFSGEDLDLETQFLETIKILADDHILWTEITGSTTSDRCQQIIQTQEANVQNLKNYYGVVVAHLQNQIDTAQNKWEDMEKFLIINQFQKFRENEEISKVKFIEEKTDLNLLEKRIQNLLQQNESDTSDMHETYKNLKMKILENQTFLNLQKLEIEKLQEKISVLNQILKDLEPKAETERINKNLSKEYIIELKNKVYQNNLQQHNELRKYCYKKYLKNCN